jgi:DNA-binding transcriptional LysR family regulator
VNVSLHQLKVFVTLARHRSFTRAADASGVTQSAVSRSIRELEEEVDLRLFDRTTRQVALTPAGENMLTRIAPLVDEIEAALHDSDGRREGERGTVQIASVAPASSAFVVRALAACRDAYAELSVTLRDRAQAGVLQMVLGGTADFGVVVDPVNLDGLVAEPVRVEPLGAVLPAGHRLVASTTLQWTHLQDAPLIVLDDDAGSVPRVARALAAQGCPDMAYHELAHPAAIAQLVRAGLGIGVAPASAFCGGLSEGLELRTLYPVLERTTMLVRRKNRSLRPAASTVWDVLVAMAGDIALARQARVCEREEILPGSLRETLVLQRDATPRDAIA